MKTLLAQLFCGIIVAFGIPTGLAIEQSGGGLWSILFYAPSFSIIAWLIITNPHLK